MPQATAIPVNAFIGRTNAPTDDDLAAELGRPAKKLWDQLLADLARQHQLSTNEWNSYSPKAGWALRVKRGTRNIVYLSPCHGTFQVSFILGDRAIGAARAAGLPRYVIDLIDQGKRYPEGTGIRFEIAGAADVAAVLQLTAIKLAH